MEHYNLITKSSKKMSMNDVPIFIKLMNHQRAMVYNMIQLELKIINDKYNDAYAMMSDKVGAGKTFAMLAYLYIMNKMIFKNKKQVNLIVVPFNICTQWKQSLYAIFGPPDINKINYYSIIEYSDIISLYTNPENLFKYDILLTTSLYFDTIAKTINSLNLKIERVIFDEADTISNLLSTELNCNITWFISASMSSLFKYTQTVDIGNYHLNLIKLKEHDIYCDPEFVNENIILPEPNINIITFKNLYRDLLLTINQQKFHEQIDAMDYRFLQSDFIRGGDIILNSEYNACLFILKHNIEQKENCIKLIEEYKELYEKYIKNTEYERAQNVKDIIDKYQVLFNESIYILNNFDNFIKIYNIDDKFEEVYNYSKCDKIKNVIKDIYIKNTNAQTMIFSNHDYIYSILKQFMFNKNITFHELDGGNIEKMDNIINAFKQNKFSVLLADSNFYSCGMNLENISDIIFIHNMEKTKENQVIGRALRYGRVGTLNIWYINYDE